MKEELKNEALIVNNLLTEYVAFHNEFLKSAGTFRSLFRKVNFDVLAGNSYSLFEKIRVEENKIKEMNGDLEGDLEKDFFNSLMEYTGAVRETVYLLFLLVNALKNKTEGKELSFNNHMENDKKYKTSINKYMVLGDKLNHMYSKLTSAS